MPEPKAVFDRICYPVDPLSASSRALAHALKLAAAARGGLTLLHTGNTGVDAPNTDFSRVRQTLERWNMLSSGSRDASIATLGLDVQNVISLDSETVRSVVRYLRRHPHDLIVLATHSDGFQHWLHPEAPTLGRTPGMTLLLPHETEGFISETTGEASLGSILIPVDNFPDPQRAVDSARELVDVLGCTGAEGTLLYVGDRVRAPEIRHLEPGSVKWRWAYREGEIDVEILRAADEYHADLVVMATEGRHGFLDAFRGSTTERIVRQTRRPVLAVPAYRGEATARKTVAADLATGKLTV
jgi:nucleotide-binding universal stress UspA family protein